MSWPGFDRGDLVSIAVGGVAGASLRWLITRREEVAGGWFTYAPGTNASFAIELGFPGRTLIVNVLGCLLLGALTLLLTRPSPLPRRLLVGAATGFCGSLTTFSTFAVEVAERLRGLPAQAQGSQIDPLAYGPEVGTALAYLLISLIGGAAAFWLGRTLTKRIVMSPGDISLGGGQ